MAIKDKAATAARQAAQGISFSFSDELIDAFKALDKVNREGITLDQAWNDVRKESQAALARDWEDSPILSIASNIAGSLPIGLSKGAVSAANWAGSGSNLAQLGKAFSLGAGAGGLTGLGQGDGSIGNRLESGLYGATLGGIGGAVLSPLARMAQARGKPDFNKVTSKSSSQFTNKAERELAKKLAARPDLREQLAKAETISTAAKQSGIDLTLAEKVAQSSSDPLLAEQAVLAGNPMTAGRMQQLYTGRSGTEKTTGQIEDALLRHVRELTGGKDAYEDVAQSVVNRAGKAGKQITRDLTAKAQPLYAEAFTKKVPNAELRKLMKEEPIIKNALAQAKRDERFSAALKGKRGNSIEALDAAKKIIDEKIQMGKNPAAPMNTSAYSRANAKLLGLADQYAPTYSQARSVYSDAPDQLAMRERIGALADVDPLQLDKVSNQLFSGTRRNTELASQALGPEGSREAAAARILRAMDKTAGDPVTYAGKIRPDPISTDMLNIYSGGDEALNQTLDVIDRAKMGERVRMGSPTQPRMQAENALAEGALETGLNVATGGQSGLLRSLGGAVAKILGRGTPESDPQFYADMADLMLTDRGMDLMRRVALGQQNAIQELQSSLPALAASKIAPQSPLLSAAGAKSLLPSPVVEGQPIEQPQGMPMSPVAPVKNPDELTNEELYELLTNGNK